MPDSSVLDRLVDIAEFMLQASLPEPTKQLLAASVDQSGVAAFAPWLATYDAVVAAEDEDQRLIIREQTQEQWVNSMRMVQHPLAQSLVAIYDAANAPIAPGLPPLTEEAADAVIDIYAFQSSVVNGVEVAITPAQRNNWKQHLAASYPMLDPITQQQIGAAPLAAPVMRAGWKAFTPAQKQAQQQAWAAGLPQVMAWINGIMQGPVAGPAPVGSPAPAAYPAGGGQPQQMTPQQVRQHDRQVVNALQNVMQSQRQMQDAVARNMRA
jgi:hypothetical protein